MDKFFIIICIILIITNIIQLRVNKKLRIQLDFTTKLTKDLLESKIELLMCDEFKNKNEESENDNK